MPISRRQTRSTTRILQGAIPLMRGLDQRGRADEPIPDDPPNIPWMQMGVFQGLQNRQDVLNKLRELRGEDATENESESPSQTNEYRHRDREGSPQAQPSPQAGHAPASNTNQLMASNEHDIHPANRASVPYPHALVSGATDENSEEPRGHTSSSTPRSNGIGSPRARQAGSARPSPPNRLDQLVASNAQEIQARLDASVGYPGGLVSQEAEREP